MEASEDRSSDERYDGPVQSAKLANSGPRHLGATSSPCRGASRNAAVACASWVPSFLAATYFQACERHRHHKKNECTFFCITCGVKPHSVCQHCMGAHAGHQVIQVRRYVYCDVVRACDISPFVDASGVQNYIINSAKVMFLNHRPHTKIGRANGVDICRTCHRHLREGYSYCSLACKVEALTKGETAPACAPDAVPRRAAVAAEPTVAGLPPPGAAAATASSYSPRPRSIFVSRAAAAAAAVESPDLASAAADASCAAFSSDLDSSEPGEDTFVFGGAGGGSGSSPLETRAAVTAAAAARRRTAPAVRDRDSSSHGSSTSRDKQDKQQDYEYNFENPPKRRRTAHIVRRPSTSNCFSAQPFNGHSVAAAVARAGSLEPDAAAEAEAAAEAAATLLMPFRAASMPVPSAPPPPSTAVATSSLWGSAEAMAPAGAGANALGSGALDLGRAASASAVLSRRKQHAPQRAPSC